MVKSAYIHIPFCNNICSYCDFCKLLYNKNFVKKYLDALGTGFIITEDGYIISNEHVTGSKYSKCYITLESGENHDGTVVWSDSDLDLSIIKINAKNLPYVNLGDSSQIRVGETVYAIRKSYRI